MSGTVAVSQSLDNTINVLAGHGVKVVPLSAPAGLEAEIVVYSCLTDYQDMCIEDLRGDSGTVFIDGDAREPNEVLTLVMNRLGFSD